jgi:hypothetical protein
MAPVSSFAQKNRTARGWRIAEILTAAAEH